MVVFNVSLYARYSALLDTVLDGLVAEVVGPAEGHRENEGAVVGHHADMCDQRVVEDLVDGRPVVVAACGAAPQAAPGSIESGSIESGSMEPDPTGSDPTGSDSTGSDPTAPERRDWRFWRRKPDA